MPKPGEIWKVQIWCYGSWRVRASYVKVVERLGLSGWTVCYADIPSVLHTYDSGHIRFVELLNRG